MMRNARRRKELYVTWLFIGKRDGVVKWEYSSFVKCGRNVILVCDDKSKKEDTKE